MSGDYAAYTKCYEDPVIDAAIYVYISSPDGSKVIIANLEELRSTVIYRAGGRLRAREYLWFDPVVLMDYLRRSAKSICREYGSAYILEL